MTASPGPSSKWHHGKLAIQTLYRGSALGAAVGLIAAWMVHLFDIGIWLIAFVCMPIRYSLLEYGIGSGIVGGVMGSVIADWLCRPPSARLRWIAGCALLTAGLTILWRIMPLDFPPCRVSF